MYSVVIPSRTASNLVPCIRAIREAGETARIIVVDDGVDWIQDSPDGRCRVHILGELLRDDGVVIVPGAKPFCFARNVNIGIRAAGDDDVIVLNDDALLKTPGGFTAMAAQATRGTLGLIASSCNMVGNRNQHQRPEYATSDMCRAENRMVCFVCIYIPRATINAVGLLDERFVDYGCEDDDYCLRVRNAGLKLGIFDGCYVDHGSLKSSFRGEAGRGGDFQPNLRRFIAKWGVDNHGMDREHSKYAHLFPPDETVKVKVKVDTTGWVGSEGHGE